jgi:hypothetical protein
MGSVLLALFACEERIELDVKQVPDTYVLDGLVTNRLERHYLRIKKAVDFYESGSSPDVEHAHVMVRDNAGNAYEYLWSTFERVYLSEMPFKGVVGRVYTLEVDVDEIVFYAVDSMRPISGISEVTWAIDPVEQQNPQKAGYFYQALLTTMEPQETKDYYLFKIYRNDTIQRFDDHTGVFVTDDVAIGEKIENFPAPVYYALDDWGKFEVYSLTPEAFRYYFDLSQILNNDGGMFSGIPANPVNNIIGDGGLGFFQVSAVALDSVRIGDPDKTVKF